MKDIVFEIKQQIAVLSENENGNYRKELNLISWNRGTPVLDLRTWKTNNEERIPLKGTTLTKAESAALAEALAGMKPPE